MLLLSVHVAAIAAAACACSASAILAQPDRSDAHRGHQGHHGARAPVDTSGDVTAGVHDAMGRDMIATAHLRLSPPRVPNAADSARAGRIVAAAREALETYRDVRAAERDGYRMFAANVNHQQVYHFTSLRAAIRERFRFDPAQPASLLYRKDSAGALRLVGAMYTAPKDAAWDELDQRVPLSMAQWHLHTNMCVPKLRERHRWLETANGLPVFGPASPIATREACDAVRGRFLPVVFNWMVHVNVYEADVWGH